MEPSRSPLCQSAAPILRWRSADPRRGPPRARWGVEALLAKLDGAVHAPEPKGHVAEPLGDPRPRGRIAAPAVDVPGLRKQPARRLEPCRVQDLASACEFLGGPLPLSAPGEGGAEIGTKKLGEDPDTGLEVTLRSGRFGPYVQLGEATDGEKPKRASLPKNVTPEDVELDFALALLSLPREVGRHPEGGEPIRAGIGRFGPYVQHDKTYANLESGDDVFNIGLNRAVTLIAEKRAKGPRFRRFGADPGRPLGEHPTKGGPVVAERPLRAVCQP